MALGTCGSQSKVGMGGFQLELTTCGFSPCKPLQMSFSMHNCPWTQANISHPQDPVKVSSAVCNKPPASHHAPNTGIHQELPSPAEL